MSKNDNAAPLPQPVQRIVDELFERIDRLSPAGGGLIAAYKAIANSFESGGPLYICGNGGSFADAVHIKGELAKSFILPRPISEPKVVETLQASEQGQSLLDKLEVGLPVIVLGESDSLRSAYENDKDPHLAYAQELNSFAPYLASGVLLGISTSGSAKNVIAATLLAKAYGIVTIGFTGPNGGELARLADIPWQTVGETTPDIQENQLPLYHALCKMLEAHFFQRGT